MILASALVPLAAAGCSLFTSLDGLSGGSTSEPDSAVCTTCDGGVDSNPIGDSNTPPEDTSVSNDAAPDQSTPPGSFICGNGTMVDSCTDCPGASQPCVTCNDAGATSPQFCVNAGDSCRDDPPPGYSAFTSGCDCSGGASACPEAYQVCHNSEFCHTCGEPMSNGEPCQAGGTCSAGSGTCH
jgi:hypothetical protein